MEDYQRIKRIGQGTYGVIYKYKNKRTGKYTALKEIRIENDDEGLPTTASREISVLKELSGHPNIIGLRDVIMQKQKLYLVFDYLSMDLKKYIDSYGSGKQLTMPTVKSLTYQLLRGILFCHSRGILHRDINPWNIFVNKDRILKIADFGLASASGVPIRAFTFNKVKQLWYRSPEVLLGSQKYDCPMDIWSVGCIMAELINKKPLFQGNSQIVQLYSIFRVLKTPTEEIWPGVNELLENKIGIGLPKWNVYSLEEKVPRLDPLSNGMELLKEMFIYSQTERISAKTAVNHSFFDDFNKTRLPEAEQD